MLRHLDELDQECSNLHEELRGAITSRDMLQAEVDRIQNECTQLQGRLLEKEVRGTSFHACNKNVPLLWIESS